MASGSPPDPESKTQTHSVSVNSCNDSTTATHICTSSFAIFLGSFSYPPTPADSVDNKNENNRETVLK